MICNEIFGAEELHLGLMGIEAALRQSQNRREEIGVKSETICVQKAVKL